MANDKVILYDLPSKDQDNACWSLNPWKTRLALNYKGIDYQTQWVEYPDVEPLLKSFGLAPQPHEPRPFTLPTVRFPQDGAHFMDSKIIVKHIEERYPAPQYPSLHLDDPVVEQSYDLVRQCIGPLMPNVLPQIPRHVLNDRSAEYFWATRKEFFGMSLDEYEAQNGGEQAWEKSRPGWANLAEALRREEGPFFLGNTVSYADFVIVGMLHFLKRAVGDKEFERINEWPEVIALHKACAKWLERDGH